jgi:hypothetical protein
MAKSMAIENNDQVAVLVTSGLCIVIPALAVGLRFIAKTMRGGHDYSDYCIVAALVCVQTLERSKYSYIYYVSSSGT